jgi:hypothetical protein
MYFGELLFDRHEFAVWAGGHVAAGQYARKRVRRRFDLQVQDVGKSAFAGFDDGAAVMGDQPAPQGVGMLGVAQVPGAIELVQAREGKAGGVADVVQPCGGSSRPASASRTGARLRAPRVDALHVRPNGEGGVPAGAPGQAAWPRIQRVHAAQASHLRRDVHGRSMPSEDALLGVTSDRPAMQASARPAWQAPSWGRGARRVAGRAGCSFAARL